nr:hypothetical protein [Parabacteroides goldsteinii]
MTGQQIEDSIYELLKMSSLPHFISGGVYKFGTRPKDSTKEDAVVKFVAGLPGQIHTGVVVVNLYVPDFAPYGDGVLIKDIARCTELEVLADEWVKSLTADKSNFRFWPDQTICTEEAPEINQHFVNVKLKFELSTI